MPAITKIGNNGIRESFVRSSPCRDSAPERWDAGRFTGLNDFDVVVDHERNFVLSAHLDFPRRKILPGIGAHFNLDRWNLQKFTSLRGRQVIIQCDDNAFLKAGDQNSKGFGKSRSGVIPINTQTCIEIFLHIDDAFGHSRISTVRRALPDWTIRSGLMDEFSGSGFPSSR